MKNRYRLSEDEKDFFSSVRNGDLSSVKHALRLEPYLVSFKDECGNTPLHWGSRSGSPDMVKLILSCGADPNTKNDKGETPLAWVLGLAEWKWGQPTEKATEILEAIIQAGVDIVSLDESGRNLLHRMALFGRIAEAQVLIEHGVDPNITDASGSTPLHWAAAVGEVEIVSFLIECGADVNIRNSDGYTPIHKAVCARIEPKYMPRYVHTIERLISHGADLTVRTKTGKTLEQFAKDENPGRPQIADVLNKHANTQ